VTDPRSTTLTDLLAGWIPQQRWFAGKGRAISSVSLQSRALLDSDAGVRTLDLVLAVDHEGEIVRYQVPVTLRAEVPADLGHARIGECDEGVVHDGLVDPAGNAVWLRRLSEAGEVDGVTFSQRVAIDRDLPGRIAGVEQSNTSVVYGEGCILKVFRRLAPGVNPDLEVTRALAEAGSTHIPEPLGWVTGEVAGEPTTLAFLQRFLRNGTDGWRLATGSVRDLFAEADLHADEVGGDFAGESERLGRATAEVHASLRGTLASAEVGGDEARATAAQMEQRLDRAVAEIAALAPYAEALRTTYVELAATEGPTLVQRVHGDYHLGQVLRTDAGWTLLDFEGEPARPLAERTALMSPLRDVAGMLRSFDYAARSLLAEHPGEPHLAYRATEWADRNRDAFCDGYAVGSGRDPRSEGALLRAFELDKAVYEVVYEARHRPSWLAIPLGAVERLAQG